MDARLIDGPFVLTDAAGAPILYAAPAGSCAANHAEPGTVAFGFRPLSIGSGLRTFVRAGESLCARHAAGNGQLLVDGFVP